MRDSFSLTVHLTAALFVSSLIEGAFGIPANFRGNGKVSGLARGPIPEGAVCAADWGS